ncbi:MAG: TonB-dependent receptor [Flavobacteriales bacterium]
MNYFQLNILFILFSFIITNPIFSQNNQKDTPVNIFGHVVCDGEYIPFASIGLKGSTIGTASDATGHYQFIDMPLGHHRFFVSVVGYKSLEQEVTIKKGSSIEVNFELEKDVLNIDEVVVSASRSEQKRTQAPVIVNTISPKLINSTQSLTLGEGLNFSPGLRLENNCQNCGFSQVRMNGLEGPYSQILINSRPIFSGLAGVYGLELIPTNMIDKIEVSRGGGSALYGGNAIAGTINIIMKEPLINSFEAGTNYALTGYNTNGEATPDYSINFNTSVVSDDIKSGVSVYGFSRKRAIYDANNDSFSELAPLENITYGASAFHKFTHRDKLSIDYFGIKEQRDGGNMQDHTLHERDIAESLTHDLNVAGIKYEKYFREYDLLTVYGSGQLLNRDSYYGAEQSLADYGTSKGTNYNLGAHYKVHLNKGLLVVGLENTTDLLKDVKLGYLDLDSVIIDWSDSSVTHSRYGNTIVADQSSVVNGVFAQYDLTLNNLKASIGVRVDNYAIEDFEHAIDSVKINTVVSPRLSALYNVTDFIQLRSTYSQGYRAPQIFDEDLHLETSGLKQVIHKNSLDLKQETSHSYLISLDYNKLVGTTFTGILVEGFQTRLQDAFANELGEPDENGQVIYTRINSSGAIVKGLNLEVRLKPTNVLEFTSGFTSQISEYDDVQDWGSKKFLRTPNHYGFFILDYKLRKGFSFSANANYTGSMSVLYEGIEDKPTNANGIIESDSFFDLGMKLTYTLKLGVSSLQFLGGVKNIFNSYQTDFDSGIKRDPAYVYGPLSPRTIYFGLKFGNLLN